MEKDFKEAMDSLTEKYSGEKGVLKFEDTLMLLQCLNDFSKEIASQLAEHFKELNTRP